MLARKIRTSWPAAGLLMLTAIGLSGCFDLDQSVSLNRDGSGRYEVSVAARGIVGDALQNGKTDINIGHNQNIRTRKTIQDGKVTQTSIIDFKQLSDLSLSSESIAVKVRGHDLFGLGQTHAIFRRVFLVDHARHENGHDDSNDDAGKGILVSIFGDHTYSFRVTLPGSVDWIAPVWVGDTQVVPQVSGDSTRGTTIVWRMPLASMLMAKSVHFSVGFSAYGALSDSESRRDDDHDAM
jgi:hypothetical protein